MQGEVFPGTRVFPDDSRYPTLIRGFNLRWVGSPAYVQLCGTTDQVVAAVQEAHDKGLRITARGGGHCYENFVSGNDGGAIIDLSPMADVYRGADGLYCIEGGTTLWNAYGRLAKEYGVTLPGGSCYSVGAGGHVPAGGYGLLSRLHGLTVDYLHGVEVVQVDRSGKAQAVTVTASSGSEDERLLLWAHQGGGGGNFGIVTRFLFKDLPPAPAWADLTSLAWNWSDLSQDDFHELLFVYGQFLAENSGADSDLGGLFTLLHLNQNLGGASQIGLTAQDVGSASAGLRAQGVESRGTVLGDLVGELRARISAPAQPGVATAHGLMPTTVSGERLPWLFVTQTLNGSGPNRRGKYKSAYMKSTFPDTQIDAMWKALAERPMKDSQALLQVDSYGCRINAVAPDATAVAQRSSVMKLQFQIYWTDPDEDDDNLAWIRAFYEDMYGVDGPAPDDTMDGCYVGYPDADLVDWQYLYYKQNYPCLQQAKAVWDPLDVFNHAQSIELPPV